MKAQVGQGYGRPAVLIAVSGALLAFGFGRFGDDWRPVDESIDLTRPITTDMSFEARPGASYHFGVEVDRSETSSCLLGIRGSSTATPCNVDDPLDVEWRIFSEDQPVIHGSMDDWPGSSWGGGSRVAAMLDHLPPDPSGPVYDIELVVRSASPGLESLQPRFVVGIGGGERHGDMFPRLVAVFLSITAGVVAALTALQTFWRNRRAS